MPHSSAGDPPPRPATFEIVLLGRFFNDWKRSLAADSDLWTTLPVHGVSRKRRGLHLAGRARQAQRLLFPARDGVARAAPRGGWGLFPTPQAIATLGDKWELWGYVRRHGLERLMPLTWTTPQDASFPVVLKRVDTSGGAGVFICPDTASLASHLASAEFQGQQFVIQQFLPGPEFTLQAIAVDGQVTWAVAYRHATPEGTVRVPQPNEPTFAETLSPQDLADFSALLAPIAYSGPVNIDYKRAPDGRVVVFEINPRFGGSLFRPQNRADLVAAMGALIANARWLGWQTVMRLPWRTQ